MALLTPPYNHSDVDVSEWMLYHMESPRSRFGRGVVIGRIYTREGKLVVVCVRILLSES